MSLSYSHGAATKVGDWPVAHVIVACYASMDLRKQDYETQLATYLNRTNMILEERKRSYI